MAKKIEGDLAHSLKTKSGMPEGIVDQIKSSVMQKVMSSFTGEAAKNGDKGGNGLLTSEVFRNVHRWRHVGEY